MRLRLPAAVLLALCCAPALAAPVSCDDADNLCTGDPCVMPALEVLTPCVVDFGSRDLVIGGTLSVPNAGVLSFTAGSIEATNPISGRHLTSSEGDGASVTLIASGDIEVRRIDVSGMSTAGSIDLQAGGAVRLRRLLRASASGALPTSPGGSIAVAAGTSVEGDRSAKLDVRGGKNGRLTAAGSVAVAGGGSVTIGGKIQAAGTSGGTVAVNGVDVILDNEVDVSGTDLDGGAVTVVAASDILAAKDMNASGANAGGSISLTAQDGVLADRSLRLRGGDGSGGGLFVHAVNGLVALDDVRAEGRTQGGSVTIVAGSLASFDRISATGDVDGGSVSVTSSTGDVSGRDVSVRAKGSDAEQAGTVTLTSVTSDVSLSKSLHVNSDQGAGGLAELEAAGGVTIEGDIEGMGATAGATIRLDGASVELVRGADLSATQGGSLIVNAGAGGATLSDGADARATGVIQVDSGGSLTMDGAFQVGAGGCIGLSATGAIDVSAATFDVAILATCGASPSGAFLDGIAFF